MRKLLATLPAVALVAWGGAAQAGDDRPSNLEVVAEFADAGAILPGNDVRVDGVLAGTVKRIELVDNQAHLTLKIDGDFAPIHRDATVAVRPVSLLGERFVDLDRGTPSAPALESGDLIPSSQTTRSVDLDEILSAVDDPTGDGLASLITGLGAGLAGRGEDAAKAIEALGPALADTAGLLRILADQNELLQTLIDTSQPALSALGADRGARLDQLVASTKGLLDTTAANAPALGESLRRLPGALATARSAFVELAALSQDTTPLLAALRPLTGDLTGFATDLSAFADSAGPALASLDPVLARGKELIEAARPVIATLAAAGDDTKAVARSARGVTDKLPPDLSNLFDFVRNFALATSGSDGISHYLRVLFTGGAENFDGRAPLAAPQGAVSPPAATVSPPPAPVPAPGSSATGLRPEQERSLLSYLVGGDR